MCIRDSVIECDIFDKTLNDSQTHIVIELQNLNAKAPVGQRNKEVFFEYLVRRMTSLQNNMFP